MKKWRKKMKIIIVSAVISIIVFYAIITAILYIYRFKPFYDQPILDFYDLTDVSAGSNFIIGLKSDGTVVAFGANDSGECNVSEWTDIIAITTGDSHTVGLRADGTVVATGWNARGQCNVSDWSDIIAVSAAGNSHTAGLRADGTVVSTDEHVQNGLNDWNDIVFLSAATEYVAGVRADGTVVLSRNIMSSFSAGFDVSDWRDIIEVEASYYVILGLRADGTVVIAVSESERTHPIETPDLSGWNDIVNISLNRMMGVNSNGEVISTASFSEYLYRPTDWRNITRVSASNVNIVGLTTDGTIEVIWSNEQDRMLRQYGMNNLERFYDNTWGDFNRNRWAVLGTPLRRKPFWRTLIEHITMDRGQFHAGR